MFRTNPISQVTKTISLFAILPPLPLSPIVWLWKKRRVPSQEKSGLSCYVMFFPQGVRKSSTVAERYFGISKSPCESFSLSVCYGNVQAICAMGQISNICPNGHSLGGEPGANHIRICRAPARRHEPIDFASHHKRWV